MNDFTKQINEFSKNYTEAIKPDSLNVKEIKDVNDIKNRIPKEMIINDSKPINNFTPKKNQEDDINTMKDFFEEYVDETPKKVFEENKITEEQKNETIVNKDDVNKIIQAVIDTLDKDKKLKRYVKNMVEECVSEAINEILEDYFDEEYDY